MSRQRMRAHGRVSARLRLDARHGWIAGVCAGIANALDADPAFVRVAVLVTALFFPKLTIAAYLIAWAVLEKEDARPRAHR